jgi:murein DD-endopeptidase MepM/ murein hydrolase activator NlpD
MVVPERSAKVRRYRVTTRAVKLALLAFGLLVGTASYLLVSYFHIVDQASKNRMLIDESNQLKAQLRIQKEEVQRIEATMQRIHQFASKVRTITRLNDPERNLAIGPLSDSPEAGRSTVMYAKDERIDYEDELADSKVAATIAQSNLEEVETDARALESSLRELHEYFAADTAILSSTPSIRPIASKLLNSTFGMRKDPYTGQTVMHKGIDFAADHGSEVFATADGTVVFAGSRGKYGKTLVIDHGYGLQTHFSHLSAYKVELGEQVMRGQVIGEAGNTGRSTGVHLHYEVRFMGIPHDPEKYILD